MRIVNGRIRRLEIAAEVGEPDDWLGDAEGGLDGAEAEGVGEGGGKVEGVVLGEVGYYGEVGGGVEVVVYVVGCYLDVGGGVIVGAAAARHHCLWFVDGCSRWGHAWGGGTGYRCGKYLISKGLPGR